MRVIPTPEGLFVYDRGTGVCLHNPSVRSPSWVKPLYAQIAVTNRCNMNCWWCYSSSLEDGPELSYEDLVEILSFFDEWGIFGVALGGGEPFLHPKLVDVVKWTWINTGLDVTVTTNGWAASQEQIEAMEGFVSEVRVSVRSLKDVQALKRFVGRKFEVGANLLLFRGVVEELVELIQACMEVGVADFLISAFKAMGRGSAMAHLEPSLEDLKALATKVRELGARARFKVPSRVAELLREELVFAPFNGESVGRIVAITADKKVKPSSLSQEAYPFNRPEEIRAAYLRIVEGRSP